MREWRGLYYEDGELVKAHIVSDDGYTNLWISDNLRDDIDGWEDLDGLFFTDEEHFARWIISGSNIDWPPLYPEEIWELVE